MNLSRLSLLLAACLLPATLQEAHAVTIDWVTVGDTGNVADTTGYGAVSYEYRIAKYEVTIQQYTDFLNAVAKSDPYSLYRENMGDDTSTAGISRTGVSGSYAYSVIGPFGVNPSGASSPGNRPIAQSVTWFNAARFANWMQNGQGSGSTETGAYTLGGATSGLAPAKNPGAQVYIPTENEWYKAAYFSPMLNSGSGGYYTYATQSNTAPGNVIGSAANQANYQHGNYTEGSGENFSVTQALGFKWNQNYLSNVGAFISSASFYGTFDQNGNATEWNDLTGAAGSSRGVRGGGWSGPTDLSSSDRRTYPPTAFLNAGGFRLASPVAVPEPSTWVMGLAGIACGGWEMWRRRRAR